MIRFIFKSRLTLLLGSVLLVFMIIGTVKVVVKNNQVQKEITDLENQLRKLQIQNERLRGQVSESRDDDYLELQAKRKLNLKRPEESVFVFYEDQPAMITASPPAGLAKKSDTTADAPSNPVLWWRYFFQ